MPYREAARATADERDPEQRPKLVSLGEWILDDNGGIPLRTAAFLLGFAGLIVVVAGALSGFSKLCDFFAVPDWARIALWVLALIAPAACSLRNWLRSGDP